MDKRKIESLEHFIRRYADQAEAEMKCFSPYVVIHPWQFLEDEYSLEFWKDGFQHGTPEIVTGTWETVSAFVCKLPPKAEIDFSFCDSIEWLACYHLYADRTFVQWNGRKMERPKYTPEQVAKYKSDAEKEYPRIACLWNGSIAGEVLKNILVSMPERVQIPAEALQIEIQKGQEQE